MESIYSQPFISILHMPLYLKWVSFKYLLSSFEKCIRTIPDFVGVLSQLHLMSIVTITAEACHFTGLRGGSAIKSLPGMQETHLDAGSVPTLGRSLGGRHGNPLSPWGQRTLVAAAYGGVERRTHLKRLSRHTLTFYRGNCHLLTSRFYPQTISGFSIIAVDILIKESP